MSGRATGSSPDRKRRTTPRAIAAAGRWAAPAAEAAAGAGPVVVEAEVAVEVEVAVAGVAEAGVAEAAVQAVVSPHTTHTH